MSILLRILKIVLFPYFLLVITNYYVLNDVVNKFDWNSAFCYLLLLFIFAAPIFLALSYRRWLYLIFIAIFFFFDVSIFLLYQLYSIEINHEIVESYFSSEMEQVLAMLDMLLIGLAFFLLAIVCYICFRFISNAKIDVKPLSISVIILICVNLLITDSIFNRINVSHFMSKVIPLNLIYFLGEYWMDTLQIQRGNKTNPFVADKLNDGIKNLKIVLIIGESARRDHFSINGYLRNTNPKLSKIPNLITYKNANSKATHTIRAIKHLMKINSDLNQYSYLTLFNMNGFKTLVLSNQGKAKSSINDIYSEASTLFYMDRIEGLYRDEYLLPQFSKYLEDKGNQLFVIHTFGSHHQYDARYPEQFRRFAPTCDQTLTMQSLCTDITALNNSYDNSILYTDFFLAEFIKTLEKHEALFIYISDHGESLGENGYYLLSADIESAPKEQTQIPLIFWASDKFINKYPKHFKSIQQNQEKYVDHKNIFPTIIECTGFDKNYDQSLSLCSY